MWYSFFFNDTATTEIYTLSLHDALPICLHHPPAAARDHLGSGRLEVLHHDGQFRAAHAARAGRVADEVGEADGQLADRKSTRLNSSHANISYAVFCLKKKKTKNNKTCTI